MLGDLPIDALPPSERAPLADRMRPGAAAEIEGQDHLLGPGTLIGTALKTGRVPSLVFWGPPGCGKTTLARLLAEACHMPFVALSAVTSGVKDVRQVIARAKESDGGTLLFVDEIHRFNKAQQDAFLPHIEDGTITLVGATTENPGFSLIRALQSRVRIVVLEALSPEGLQRVLERALSDPARGLGARYQMAEDASETIVSLAGGDARRLLGILESAVALADAEDTTILGAGLMREAAQTRARAHDRSGDDRYDLLSAFHKSLRGSDVDAALFWMVRLLDEGEDPRVVLRRLIAMASEDVGLADPRALRMALDAREAVEVLGLPEGRLALGQAVIYCALAPKSDSVKKALGTVAKAVVQHGERPVPLHLRNAPTAFAKGQGHGKGYRYPHDFPHGFVNQRYLPEPLDQPGWFEAKEVGDEREIAKRLAWWRRLRARDGGDPRD